MNEQYRNMFEAEYDAIMMLEILFVPGDFFEINMLWLKSEVRRLR